MDRIPSFLTLPVDGVFSGGFDLDLGDPQNWLEPAPHLDWDFESFPLVAQVATAEPPETLETEDQELPAQENSAERFAWRAALCTQVASVLRENKDQLSCLNSEAEIVERISELLPDDSPLTKERIYGHLIKGRKSAHARSKDCGNAYHEVYTSYCTRKKIKPVKRRREASSKTKQLAWGDDVCRWLCKQVEQVRDELTGMKRGKYDVLIKRWELAIEAGSAPTTRVPSRSALRSHLQLRSHRGSDEHRCWQLWEPVMRGEKKRQKHSESSE